VVEIGGFKKSKYSTGNINNFFGDFNDVFEAVELQSGQCRICLEESSELNDFLIDPCKCSGTSGLIHLGCLKKWMNGQYMNE
jgi:hypothetical protein